MESVFWQALEPGKAHLCNPIIGPGLSLGQKGSGRAVCASFSQKRPFMSLLRFERRPSGRSNQYQWGLTLIILLRRDIFWTF